MDVAKLFQQSPDLVYIRLALEEWTELPPKTSAEWESLSQMVRAATLLKTGRVFEIDHNGVDVYLLLRPELNASIGALVGELRQLLHDPFWRPFIDLERYAWVGDYHAVSMWPGEKLGSRPLEHPARTWKREHMELDVGRQFEHPWHEAPSPEALRLEFLECAHVVHGAFLPDAEQFTLWFRKPEDGRDEAWAAAHLNTRLRLPGNGPMFESVGWDCGDGAWALVFSIPVRHFSQMPDHMELWWATDVRKPVGTVPLREAKSRWS